MTTTQSHAPIRSGRLEIVPFPQPQGCRTWLAFEPASGRALAVDVHLDAAQDVAAAIRARGLDLALVLDTHTHADHPSGSADLAAAFPGVPRAAHESAGHAGITRPLRDGDVVELGQARLVVRHAPGHTPDHVALAGEGVLFSGDSLFIGAVARTDFLGGDAGVLFDTLRSLLAGLPDETLVLPGHDYQGRISSTLGAERAANPWLRMDNRARFVAALTASPPPRPANMDDLLRLNREGVRIATKVPVADAIALARAGGAARIFDVRTAPEVAAERVPGAVHVPLDEIASHADAVRAAAAPRLLLCRSGARAERARLALEAAGVRGLQVIEGGIEAWRAAGGPVAKAPTAISLDRQMRIAAGSMVGAGLLLALVHPAFLALPALVAAGLIFSGITDRCGLVLLLAKMPWNRSAGAAACAAPAAACAAPALPAACAAPAVPAACAAPSLPGDGA